MSTAVRRTSLVSRSQHGYVPIRTTLFVLPWGTRSDTDSDDREPRAGNGA